MSGCERQCQGIEDRFDTEAGAQKLREYLRNGPDRTTQLLVDALRTEGVADATLLDIGGGIGNCNLARNNIAQIRQLPAEPLLMRIQHPAQHQLAAGIDEFDVHDSIARKAVS